MDIFGFFTFPNILRKMNKWINLIRFFAKIPGRVGSSWMASIERKDVIDIKGLICSVLCCCLIMDMDSIMLAINNLLIIRVDRNHSFRQNVTVFISQFSFSFLQHERRGPETENALRHFGLRNFWELDYSVEPKDCLECMTSAVCVASL